jgi:putative ABC transport system permease protein
MLRPPSSVLGTAPWRRAPLLLRRSPAVLLAVLAAGLILGAAAAATPLFLSSAANAALARQMEERCPPTYGFQVRASGALGGPVSAEEADRAPALGGATAWPAGRELLAIRERTVRQAGTLVPNLGQPVLGMSGPLLQLAGATPDRQSGGRLLYRDGFENQIRKLGSAPGVYQELHRLPPTPYWCAQGEDIYPPGYAEDPPPPLVLADRATFTAVSRRLQEPRLAFAWDLELAGGLSLAEARESAAAFPAASEAVAAEGGGMIAPEEAVAFNSPGVAVTNSALPFLVQRSDAIVAAVGGAIGPVAIAGTAVALLLVAAAGSYWVDRRRVEVALLAARGVGALAIAAKAMLEMLLWLALGSVPEQLSGGEQQRLAFAAAVIGGPALVVADEPTAELDTEAGERLMRAVLGLRDHGTSLVLSSHDPVVTGAVDGIVRLHDGEVT